MMYKSRSFNSMKTFLKAIESRIPLHLKIVAETRFLWHEIVGEHMAYHSHVSKCEYIPKKNEEGQDTGEFHRKLVVWVDSMEIQAVMTSYVGEYLDCMPKNLKIHSMRFVYTHKPFVKFQKKKTLLEEEVRLSSEEIEDINKRILSLQVEESKGNALKHFLITWKIQQKRENMDRDVK